MSEKDQRIIRLKWVRSGIGFTYRQKRIVQSLGLKKLNQEVERPDTPQIRGLVARVPHLVEIVDAPSKAAWTLVPEYTIHPPVAAAKPAETPLEASAKETAEIGAATTGDTTDAPAAAETTTGKAADPAGAGVAELAGPGGAESAAAADTASPEKGAPEV